MNCYTIFKPYSLTTKNLDSCKQWLDTIRRGWHLTLVSGSWLTRMCCTVSTGRHCSNFANQDSQLRMRISSLEIISLTLKQQRMYMSRRSSCKNLWARKSKPSRTHSTFNAFTMKFLTCCCNKIQLADLVSNPLILIERIKIKRRLKVPKHQQVSEEEESE
jgi:hypothetical protein